MMGCSGIASSEGYESAYFNPSLLPTKKNFGLGFLYSSQDITVSQNGTKLNTLGNPIESVRQIGAGFSISLADIPFVKKGSVSENIYFGLSAFLPASKSLIRVTTFQSKIPSALLYGSRNTRFSVYTGLGGKIPLDNINIYLGAGAYAFADLPIFVEANISPDKDLLTVDGSLDGSFAPVVGASFEILNRKENPDLTFRIGGSYRGGLGIKIPTEIKANLLGEEILSLLSTLIFMYTPDSFGGGILVRKKFGEVSLSVGGDLVRMLFSKLKSPFLSVDELKPEELSQALPLPSIQQPALKDILVIRGGVGLDLENVLGNADLSFGLGAYHFPSPLAGVEQKSTFLVDGDRIAVLGGIGAKFPVETLVQGDVGIFLTGGAQIISKTTVKSNYGQAEVEGTLPIFSVTATIDF
jgi:hypothetical protein